MSKQNLFCPLDLQKWHKYRLTMNKTELEIHKAESGEEGLLITINVFI